MTAKPSSHVYSCNQHATTGNWGYRQFLEKKVGRKCTDFDKIISPAEPPVLVQLVAETA